ncbi:hypothetical protein [Coleofasciculus sp. FACHB-712]|uniref:hypothetical protein n=1 Tax=Coleofasciculus sp. FACHB-712 TaxID=2692789 RepID=UPI001686DB92|nr:hypothetical protein [Coleofasciculus sp. FACHB-712]
MPIVNLSDLIEDLSNTLKALREFKNSLHSEIANLPKNQRDNIVQRLTSIEDRLSEEHAALVAHERQQHQEHDKLIEDTKNSTNWTLSDSLNRWLLRRRKPK